MVVIGIDAVLSAPYKAGVITTVTLLGGVNLLVNLFDQKAEQRRTAEAREEAAEARERALRAERQAEASERENAQLRQRIAEPFSAASSMPFSATSSNQLEAPGLELRCLDGPGVG